MAIYTAYEIDEGQCLEDVEAICNHLTLDGTFSESTQPRSADVYRRLTLAHHKIAGLLAMNGYAVAQTDEETVGILQQRNAIEVAIWAELANPITGVGEPNERFKALADERDALVELIEGRALDDLGATRTTGTLGELVTATGVSRDRKISVEDDTDLVGARFKRGFGLNPRTGGRSYGDTDWVDQR